MTRSKTAVRIILAGKIAGVAVSVQNRFSRMYTCSSYDLRKHRSSVVVAEHTIFDPRVMIGLSDYDSDCGELASHPTNRLLVLTS